MDKNKIILYTDKNGNVELRADVEKDTLWATLNQISDLFNVQKAAISKHLTNIYDSGELLRDSTVSKMETVQLESGREVKRKIDYYNLDAIIAVGYRINSKKATQFRIWATAILHGYLVKGYNLNRHKLAASEEAVVSLDEAITLMKSGDGRGPLKGKLTLKLTKKLMP